MSAVHPLPDGLPRPVRVTTSGIGMLNNVSEGAA